MDSLTLYILIFVVVAVFFWVIKVYNSLIAMIQAIINNFKQIDIQLDRRAKIFTNLIEVVKKAMSHEMELLTKVTELRNTSLAASKSGDTATKMAAENQISSLIPQLSVQFEAYPQVTAGTNALQLQEEIVSTENKLAYAKQAYNDSIEKYEAKKQSFLEAFVVSIFSKLNKSFEQWGLTAEKRQENEDMAIKF
ncbi:MAG TPA: LemA family protein [Candidatus Thioglobus sp.]|jgi:LemA protein|nr:LemA family protein [Candidatus Thioglobus sp.]